MTSSSFTPLYKVLPGVVNRYQLAPQVHGAVVCRQFEKLAPQLWPHSKRIGLKAQSYRDGVLTLLAASSSWAQEAHFKNSILLKHLGSRLYNYPVNKIRTTIGSWDNFHESA